MNKLALKLLVNVCLVRVEHVTFNHELPTCDDQKQLALYLRYQTTNERAFHKCLNDLLKLRAERHKQELASNRKSESGMGKSVKNPSTIGAKQPKSVSKMSIDGTFCSLKRRWITRNCRTCGSKPPDIESRGALSASSQPKTSPNRRNYFSRNPCQPALPLALAPPLLDASRNYRNKMFCSEQRKIAEGL
jgi:hypothetical protein